jgi:hypothetical protein
MVAEGMAGIAAVGHHPARHVRQPGKQADGLWQFMRLFWYEAERSGTAIAIRARAGRGSIGPKHFRFS